MVIDGHSLAFRAFFALPVDSFVNSEGQHTNAIHGFISMLLSLLRDENPSHLAVAFDAGSQSFRNRIYEEYKGGRDETPPEFRGQIGLLKEALQAMGITWLEKDDFEADDILATLAHEGERDGYEVLVVSGDRDAIQLVNEKTTLLYPAVQGVSKLTRYTPDAVEEKYGVRPEQYSDLAAMVGEKADNLPGVPKVGPKTAAKWLAQFGSLTGVLEHEDELTGKVGESFREHRENAIRNRELNQLLVDVELPYQPNDLDIRAIDVDAVREVFTRLQFRTLQDRVLKLAAERDGAVATAEHPASELDIDVNLGGDALTAWLEREQQACPKGIGLRLDFVDGKLAEAGLGGAESAATVIAADDAAPLLEWLASDAPKTMFDAKPTLKAALAAGIEIGGAINDAQVAAFLGNPTGVPKRLAELVHQFLGETLPEADPNELVPVEDATNSLGADAWFVRRGAEAAIARLPEPTRPVFDEIEAPLIPVLAQMEHTGVAVEREFLQELADGQSAKVVEYEQEAFDAVGGERFNLASPKQLQTVLFDQLDMPKTRRTKTGYSTDAESLEALEAKSPHPFLGALRRHRDASKLKQIMESLLKTIDASGRIHTTYQQTAAATGRLASTDPNLQNIPIRSVDGMRIREAFVAGEGYDELLTADYSQIEMRIMAHLSGDEDLIEAFVRGEDTHRFVGSRVFGVAPEEVDANMRTKVKAMSYGLVYGLSPFGLSKQLGIEVSEARQLIEGYFERFGKVRDYLRNSVLQAKEDGYTETLFGRRRPFGDLNSTNRVARENAERAALNAPIQGAAADIIKIAMVRIDARMRAEEFASRMLLQVHDELVFEVAPDEGDRLEALVREEMGGAAELRVPLDVSVGRGANWQTAGH
ncbi:DNA polymerase I [Gulosibacter macacae]|uniref:DNA polymerase I n=1 Tax=Gulosibacter macacae TaxID=2488791 RepID=A0A3P3VXW9_9MICO|nr:DNA polymerase I [Gulosibacter macacae]RRJ87334.1 DNA polymerase I [Gulosibacter macacae]